jgi:hypothetical protein
MPAVNEAIDLAKHDVPSVVVVRREEEAAASVAYDLRPSRDHDFAALVASPSRADPVPLSASAPLYTIYTSGSTGDPKGILRDNSHAVTLKWSMTAYYGTAPGETFFAASDIGVRTQAICHCLRFLDLFLTDCLCSQMGSTRSRPHPAAGRATQTITGCTSTTSNRLSAGALTSPSPPISRCSHVPRARPNPRRSRTASRSGSKRSEPRTAGVDGLTDTSSPTSSRASRSESRSRWYDCFHVSLTFLSR